MTVLTVLRTTLFAVSFVALWLLMYRFLRGIRLRHRWVERIVGALGLGILVAWLCLLALGLDGAFPGEARRFPWRALVERCFVECREAMTVASLFDAALLALHATDVLLRHFVPLHADHILGVRSLPH